ncbi:MAG: hypothetical protein IKU84_04025, partial [Clostridia bacterium]|nr:hypothetical protein [Clostridia bacterium]
VGGTNIGTSVAVPEKIFGLTLFLDFFDRCHSLRSFHPPPAALPSLPPYVLPTFAIIRRPSETLQKLEVWK